MKTKITKIQFANQLISPPDRNDISVHLDDGSGIEGKYITCGKENGFELPNRFSFSVWSQ